MKGNISVDGICRALINARNGRWDSLVERTCHRLGCKDLLTLDLVARVTVPRLQYHHALAHERQNISADGICRALINASNGRWDSLVERTLHRLGCKNLLNPDLVARVIIPGLQYHHALALGFFDWAAQQAGYTHNSTSYEALIQSLKNGHQFRTIEKLIKRMKLQKLHFTPTIFTTVVTSQIQANRPKDAYRTFREMKSMGYRLGENMCNALLGSLASGGCIDLAKGFYCEMRAHSVGLGAVGFGVFIGAFCRSGEVKVALEMIEGARGVVKYFRGSIIATLVIHGLCQGNRIDEAWWVLEELRARGCKPDFVAYQIVVEALRDSDRFDEAQGVLKQKRKLSVAPYAHEYRDFIFELIGERRVREAHEIAGLIRKAGFALDEEVFTLLIGSLTNVDADAALSLFRAMLASGHVPPSHIVCSLIQGLCNDGKGDDIWQVFEEFVQKGKGFVADRPTYNFIVFSLCKCGKVREAYKVLETMRKKEVYPHVETYNTLMDACCKADLLRPARRLWDEMFREGCHPNAQTYNILIVKFSKVGEVQEAERLFRQMLQKDVAPDALTYGSLIDGLTKFNKLEEAHQIYNDYMKRGLGRDVPAPNVFVGISLQVK